MDPRRRVAFAGRAAERSDVRNRRCRARAPPARAPRRGSAAPPAASSQVLSHVARYSNAMPDTYMPAIGAQRHREARARWSTTRTRAAISGAAVAQPQPLESLDGVGRRRPSARSPPAVARAPTAARLRAIAPGTPDGLAAGAAPRARALPRGRRPGRRGRRRRRGSTAGSPRAERRARSRGARGRARFPTIRALLDQLWQTPATTTTRGKPSARSACSTSRRTPGASSRS